MNSYINEKRKTDLRVKWMIKNKLNHFMYTISPAPKNSERREIESLFEALKYYKEYTDSVVIQPKYMGSYCSIYAYKSGIEQTKFFSRNGYNLDWVGREDFIEAFRPYYEDIFWENVEGNSVIYQAELLPWKKVGKGLIEKEFESYGYLHQERLKDFQQSFILDKINSVKFSEEYKDYQANGSDKKHIERQYEALSSIEDIDLRKYSNSIDLYKEQLDIFGKEDKTSFKIFNCLKEGGVIPTRNSQSEGICLSLREDDFWQSVNRAYEYFDKHSSLNYEGIVVKPLFQKLINIAPALKVRTNKYLQLIYGVNFDRDFDEYFQKRNIKLKLTQSIKEYELDCLLLNLEEDELTEQNEYYVNLLYKVLDCENFEKTIDKTL